MHLFIFPLAEVEFNVSEAFVPLTTPNSNHSFHTGNDSDSGTLERKRPASMAVMEGDLVKKERYDLTVHFQTSSKYVVRPVVSGIAQWTWDLRVVPIHP